MKFAGEGVVENLVDEGAFARAADAGHRDEGAEREADVDVLEVVLAGAFDREPNRGQGSRPGSGTRVRFPSWAQRRVLEAVRPVFHRDLSMRG